MSDRQVKLTTVTFFNGGFSIPEREAKDIAVSQVRAFFGLPVGCYLRDDGNIVYDEWDHNYCTEIVIRKASKIDKQVIAILKELNKPAYICQPE